MGFYDLSKEERQEKVYAIHQQLYDDLKNGSQQAFQRFYDDEDTYIRKSAYLSTGRIYQALPTWQTSILNLLQELFSSESPRVRQTVVNAAGEIGIFQFEPIDGFMEKGLFDPHHSVRNAVIGSMKKMGEKNPEPVLAFARRFLHHPDKEIRREICHGIELRGRKHPEDILPLLRELQFDKTARVRNTLVHVLGQIAYKKGCLEKVTEDLLSWENQDLVQKALDEIVDVHDRYSDFAIKTQAEAIACIQAVFTMYQPGFK